MTTYTITALNSGGSTSFDLVITVNDSPPSNLSYISPNTFTKNMAIVNLNPTIAGGTASSYSILPSLPAGLRSKESSGKITGTPTVVSAMTTYTVTALNSGGSTSFDLVITVNDSPPSNLSYISPNTFIKNMAIVNLNPTIAGGTASSYSILPSLPAGLSLNTTTGKITGTPTEVSADPKNVVKGM